MELFDAGNLDSDIVKVFILSDLHIGCKNFAGEQFIADREAIKKISMQRLYCREIYYNMTLKIL